MTTSPPPSDGPQRIDNGLTSSSFVPLTDVEQVVGAQLLVALSRARIAAYLDPVPATAASEDPVSPGATQPIPAAIATEHDSSAEDAARRARRLFVARSERTDARTIVAAALRALGTDGGDLPEVPEDPLEGVDTDTAFANLIADWHVDTITAVREAERDLSREDADWRARLAPPTSDPVWLDDDHYIPPPPPPLPRFAAPTIGAMAIIAVSIFVLGLGGQFGLASDFTLLLGISGLLLGAGILLSRLHEGPPDEDDDGSVV